MQNNDIEFLSKKRLKFLHRDIFIILKKELFSGKRKGEKELQNKKRADTKLYRQSREKIYIKGISQRRMPDFLGGHPDNLTEFISYRITGVP